MQVSVWCFRRRIARFAGEGGVRFRASFERLMPRNIGVERAGRGRIASAVTGAAYGVSPVVDPRRPLTIERRPAIMKLMAKAQTNGHLKRLSAEELAELLVLPVYKTPEEKRAALKRATSTGPRFKTRITRDMYRPG
jgi:hypothetical protein